MHAIVAWCPCWGVRESFGASDLAQMREGLADRLATAEGALASTDGDLFLGWLPDPVDAVHLALDLLALGDREGVVGLGRGAAERAGDVLLGAEPARARRLAWRGPPGSVLCTSAFREALGAPPVGIGLYRAPHDQVHRMGIEAFAVADYRG